MTSKDAGKDGGPATSTVGSAAPVSPTFHGTIGTLDAGVSGTGPDRIRSLLVDAYIDARKDDNWRPELHFVAGSPRSIVVGNAHLTFAAFSLNSPGGEIQLCGAGLVWEETLRVALLPSADNIASWPCHKMEVLGETDLNDDGFLDFAFVATIPSNRYNADVETVKVFLSDVPNRAYCFAPKLVPPSNVAGSGGLQQEVRKEIGRVGPGLLDCYSPDSP